MLHVSPKNSLNLANLAEANRLRNLVVSFVILMVLSPLSWNQNNEETIQI